MPKQVIIHEQDILNAVKISMSKEEVARHLNCCWEVVVKYIKKYNINISHFNKQKYKYLENKRFNRWTVIKKADVFYKNSKYYYICKCDCGTIQEVPTSYLFAKKKSNGCQFCRKTGKIDDFHYIWSDHKAGAIKRGLEFSITIDDLKELFKVQNGRCALSGRNIKIQNKMSHGKFDRPTASIDRINSKLGYIRSNIQLVHKDFNRMKWDLPQETFIKMCQEISEYQESKK
jgi:hypothetical protein